MRTPGLLAALFLVLAPCARLLAQAPAQEPAARARELLTALSAAVQPLRRQPYDERDRRPVAGILTDLGVQAAALRARPGGLGPRADALPLLEFEKAVVQALRQEEEFWRSRGAPRGERLPAQTAEPLERRARELQAAFSALFPGPPAAGLMPIRAGAARTDLGAPADAVARALARGGGALVDGERFFDGGRGARTVSPAGAPGAARAADRAAANALVTRNARPPVSDLALAPVPAPAEAPEGWAAPVAAGVADAFKEYRSLGGAAVLLASLAVGVLLAAASGGLGLFARLIKALCTAAIAATLLSMLGRVVAAVRELHAASADPPRRARALRELGKVGGELMIIGLMAFVGYQVGKIPGVKNAAETMVVALRAQMSRLGIAAKSTAGPLIAASVAMTPAAAPPPVGAPLTAPPAVAAAPSPAPPPRPVRSPGGAAPTLTPAPEPVRLARIAQVRFERPHVQHEFKHAADFGVTGAPSNRTLALFQQAVMDHLASVPRGIPGKFRQTVDVVHFPNPTTGINVMLLPDGKFIGAWRLNAIQLQNVLSRGSL